MLLEAEASWLDVDGGDEEDVGVCVFSFSALNMTLYWLFGSGVNIEKRSVCVKEVLSRELTL